MKLSFEINQLDGFEGCGHPSFPDVPEMWSDQAMVRPVWISDGLLKSYPKGYSGLLQRHYVSEKQKLILIIGTPLTFF